MMFLISTRRRQSCGLLSAAAVAGLAGLARADFYTGADVSLLSFMQSQNVVFHSNGVGANGDQILYDAGANLFRLRIFVNPGTTYNASANGAMQTTAYDIALAQQIKADAPKAKILLDFHYSDTWADPGHQAKPAAWTGDSTIAALETDVTNYTANTLTAFKTAGVMPDMVQVGNETTDGMLWQTGSSGAAAVGGRILFQNTGYPGLGLANNKPTQTQTNQSYKDFGGLLNAAITGVRSAQGTGPRIPVALSIDSGDLNGQPQFFFSNITSASLGNVSDFDIEGVDYYPSSNNSQKSFTFLQSNLTALANTNTSNGTNLNPSKKIMLLETDYPYTGTANGGTDPIAMWAATQAGQQQEFTDVRNLISGLPGGDGEGALWWYPEAVQVNPFTINNGGTTALFNTTANSYSALSALSSSSGAFNPGGLITATWVKNQDADWNSTANWLGGAIPSGVNAEADLLAQISAPHTLTNNASVTLGSLYINNANAYTLSGTGSLTMSVSSGSALISVLGGSHTINLPVTFASSTTISIASGAGLQFGGALTVNPGKSLAITLQSNATIGLKGSFHASSLTLTTGSVATIAPHGGNPKSLVEFDSLSFGGSSNGWLGKVDLSSNDMIVHGGNFANIASQLKAGFNAGGGYWNGSGGIVSSTAAGDTSVLTTIGYRAGGSSFDNTNTTASDVLVKYTYYGDSDLSGTLDGADYQQIDMGFGNHLIGWFNGDFNYDGIVDGADYVLIDNTFNQLAANPAVDPLAIIAESTQLIAIPAAAAVPEPAALGLLSLMGLGLMARTRRSPSGSI